MARFIARAALAVACVSPTGGLPAQEARSEAPSSCSVAFDSNTLNAQTNSAFFRAIRVRCEDVTIIADEATASEPVPDRGEWRMRGHVRIEIESAVISADTASLGFSNNRLVFGELAGNPVTLEDYLDKEQKSVRATAGRIHYDNEARVARMGEGASLVLGTSEMRGCGDILYDLDNGVVDSVSNCNEPFTITGRK